MSNLDPKRDSRDSPDSPEDHDPDTVASPEGDNETRPNQPPKPAPDGLQISPGSTHGEIQDYKQDHK